MVRVSGDESRSRERDDSDGFGLSNQKEEVATCYDRKLQEELVF